VHVVVADAAKAQDAYQATLALPVVQPASCPPDAGAAYQIIFSLANGSSLTATAHPSGCSHVDIPGACARYPDSAAYWSQLALDLGIPVSEIYPYPPQGTAPVAVAIVPGLTTYGRYMSSVPGFPLKPVATGSVPANPLYHWRTDYGTFALWSWATTASRVIDQGSDFTVGDTTVYLEYLTEPSDLTIPVWIHLDLIDGTSGEVLASSELSLVWTDLMTLALQ
jgi:hypothetical protein